ncbi:MAG: hypothetical protein IT537_25160 [Hyphomicrobiales bacterium]|nr:hypothetical protein [Hyphomicrobiales bacterium]
MVNIAMPISITADSLDELPETLRTAAKESNGKFVVSSLPTGFAVENVQGLKNALSEEKAARKSAEARARLVGDETEDDIAEARRARDAMRAGQLKSSKDIDDFKKQLEEKSASEIRKRDDRLGAREKQLQKVLIENAATTHIVKAGGGDSLRLLLPIVRDAAHIEDDEKTGELRVVLRDEHGRPLISRKAGNNDPMGWDEFVAALRDQPDLKPLFKIQATGGSGAASQSGGSAKAVHAGLDALSGAALLAVANENK